MKPDEGKKWMRYRGPEVLKPSECRKLLRGTGAQGKFANNINVRSCGESNRGGLHMKPHGWRKLRGTWAEEKVRYYNKRSATSSREIRREA